LKEEFTAGSNQIFETRLRNLMRISDGTIPIENTLMILLARMHSRRPKVKYRNVLPVCTLYNGESDSGSDLRIGNPYTIKSHVCNKAPLSSYSLNTHIPS
jgi:hypothetical protein